MEKIKGQIRLIAKTGGFKLEGDETWFNPTIKTQEYCAKLKKKDFVEIEIDEKNNVTFIKFLEAINESEKVDEEPISQNVWDAKDKRMVRMNTLNRAVDMYIADKIKKEEIIDTAVKFEKWIYG